MALILPPATRRRFLGGGLAATFPLLAGGSSWAAELLRTTPEQTEGPFYPDRFPLDTDNDLLVLLDASDTAAGEPTYFAGSVKTPDGAPLRGALVEIWQADQNGRYLHSGSGGSGERDPHFQGYGRCFAAEGDYFFRTIKPVPYGRRTPHIHLTVSLGGRRLLTTQCYIRGHEMNADDGVLRRTPEELRELLMVDWMPAEGRPEGEWSARFDVVVGVTPEDE